MRLLGYMWPRLDMSMRLRIGIAVGLLLLGKSAGLLMPWLLGRLVGVAAEQVGDLFAVMGGLILAYVSAKILSVLFIESKDIVFVGVVQRTIRKLALEVFEHLHRMPLAYHLNRQTGSLALAIERGTKAIELLLVSALFRFVPTFLEILAICVIFWGLYGIEFAAVTLATIVMYTIVTVVVAKWRIRSRRMVNESNETSSTRVLDSLINHETVKLFSAEAREARRYDQALGRYQRASIFSQWTLSALNVSQALVIAAGLGGILLLAAAGAADASEIDAGDLATLNAYLLQMFLPLGFLGTFYRFISEALVDMEKVFALLDTQTTIPDPASGQQLPQGPGEIEFRKVSIALGERPVLRDVSFVVPPAARYALVGQTGSGKTTITRLLGRLLDPDQGAVLIDGCDLREATQLSVREALAYVPQDAVMFNDTLRVNLTFGRPDATDEQILDALATARLDDFIAKLPKGLETQVGERGLKLSGGERQRLAIARALLKQPRIFVLDEATSSLDSETENLVKAAMTAATAGRTTLVIAHRLTTITDCDCILVLEDGRVVEQGRHEQLLAGNGAYARFWQMQSRKRKTSD